MGCYTLTFVPTLWWMQAFPGHLSECLWHTLTPACTVPGPAQSPSPQTSPARHQKTKAASPLPVPKCSRLGRSGFSSHGQPCSCTLRTPPLRATPRQNASCRTPFASLLTTATLALHSHASSLPNSQQEKQPPQNHMDWS